ncbi:MAG TPA: TlpA family protein disulfide reductase [Epsilonproteobacteria bacterium]|nr:TlpA family protein disulfide reductase [Campylobacterota bacterium]
MKKITVLLFITLLLCFTGCEDKKSEIPVENTIDIIDKNTTLEDKNDSPLKAEADTKKFKLNDIDNKSHTFYFNKKDIFIDDIPQKFILLNFFATWCPPCNGQLPYIADIQEEYKEKLFVAGFLVNDADKEYHEIEELTAKYNIDYFISNSKQNDTFAIELLKCLNIAENFQLPLTILYKNGKYYAHYEGAVPIEMIEHDIKKAMKNEE